MTLILRKILAVFVVMAFMLPFARAAEIPAGTVITAQNIDKYLNDTFEGHTLKSLLTKRMAWMIRTHGFEPKLIHSSKVKMDPAWVAATKKFAGTVKYNPEYRICAGESLAYSAGSRSVLCGS